MKQSWITQNYICDLTAMQHNRCGLCGEHETLTCNNKRRRLAVDHNHYTGIVRGLLCCCCNNVVKHFENENILNSNAKPNVTKEKLSRWINDNGLSQSYLSYCYALYGMSVDIPRRKITKEVSTPQATITLSTCNSPQLTSFYSKNQLACGERKSE